MATTEGIGLKTLADTYQKILHTGGSGLIQCNPILTSSADAYTQSALWLGKNISLQQVTAKAVSAGDTFFTIEDLGGGDLGEAAIILKATEGTGANLSNRGFLTLKKELKITGVQSPTLTYDNYEGGFISLKGTGWNHYIYSKDNNTYFDNGSVLDNNGVGFFKFEEELYVGAIHIDGVTNGGTINSVIINTEELVASDNFQLQSDAGEVAFIEATDDLTIAASGSTSGLVLGTSGSKFSKKVTIESIDSTDSIIKINSETPASGTGNPSIEIGVTNTGQTDYTGTQLVTIGGFDNGGTIANNTHNNGSIGELALKSPKTKVYTGALWFDVQDYDGGGDATYPSFHCGAPGAGEGVISISTQGGGTTAQSKIDDSIRELLLYTDESSNTYEINKTDITKGRLDYFHPRSDTLTLPGISGAAYTYVKGEKFSILANEGTTAAFYLDLNAGANSGTALNTIQEAAPAAVTSGQTSSGTGAHTDAEFNLLQDDIVALQSKLTAVIAELKDFRLWKENDGVAI